MRITDNPCRNCTKRSAECRLNCARYKVYHTAKLKEYDKRKKERQQRSDIICHVLDTISKSKKRNIKHTPHKNDGVNK